MSVATKFDKIMRKSMASRTSLFSHEINGFQVLGDVEISYIGFGDDSKKNLIFISLSLYLLSMRQYFHIILF